MHRRLAGIAAVALLAGSICFGSEPSIALEDPANNPGFVSFFNSDFDAAVAYFEQQTKAHPDDPAQFDHLGQSLLYREMLRNGALESQLVSGNNPFLRRPKMEISDQERQRFNDAIRSAFRLSNARLAKNPRDVLALYTLAVAHGLRANYLFLVEKAWLEALREETAARRLNEQILKIDPNFVDARLILGLDQYIVSCLSFYMRVLGSLGGFHGDKEGGIRQLEEVAKNGVLNRYDAEVILAVIYRREHRPKQALPMLKDLAQRFPRNCLFRFEQVQLYSDAGDKQGALNVLAEIERLRGGGAPGYANVPPGKIEYSKGNLLFWYGDLDLARTNLKQATERADELDLNTAVLAWLRLGQVCDLQGDHREAVEAYRETMKTAPNSEAATEARAYIASPYRRKRTASLSQATGQRSGEMSGIGDTLTKQWKL